MNWLRDLCAQPRAVCRSLDSLIDALMVTILGLAVCHALSPSYNERAVDGVRHQIRRSDLFKRLGDLQISENLYQQ